VNAQPTQPTEIEKVASVVEKWVCFSPTSATVEKPISTCGTHYLSLFSLWEGEKYNENKAVKGWSRGGQGVGVAKCL
jgi:hypothetical protein